MKKRLIIGLFSFLFVFNGLGYSQEWKKLAQQETPNFFQIQKEANRFYNKITGERKPGFKQFKRWEWFAQSRLNQDGHLDLSLGFEGWLEKENRFGTAKATGNGNWQSLGPTSMQGVMGLGRLNCIAFDPVNENILWVGSPSGGLWKSSDSGQNWSTNTDHLPNLGISDVLIHPHNSDIMYIATGDKQRGSAHSYGVMKSGDGGETWNFTGLNPTLDQKYKIGKMMFHPNNPETILCATSHGIYKTMDGGTSWSMTMEGNFFDLETHPGNASIWYATLSKDGIYRSLDSGESWTRLGTGLPAASLDIGRIAIAVAPSAPGVLYALYTQDVVSQGWIWGLYGFYKSTDGGESWNLQMNSPNLLGRETDGSDSGGQGGYALVLEVNPGDSNQVKAGSVNLWRSSDGGQRWNVFATQVHVDHHELVYRPGSGTELYACHDGGIHRSMDNGSTWEDLTGGLGTQQIYRLGLSMQNPSHFAAGTQDNGAELFNGSWNTLNGGDGMECVIDPFNPNIIYSSWQRGNVLRSENGGQGNTRIFQEATGVFSWITHIVLDPMNPNNVYTASDHVIKSEDGGYSSRAISDVFNGHSLTILKLAPSNPDVMVTSDGERIFRTDSGGQTWVELDNSVFPTFITDIAIHPRNPDIMWATVGGFGRWNHRYTWLNIPYIMDKPKVFYSGDRGVTWLDVSGLLPNIPANCVVVDPFTFGVYVGTDLGVFYTATGTGDWVRYDNGLPNVIVTEMEIHPTVGTLTAATYGRGLWRSPLAVEPDVYPPLFFKGRTVRNEGFLGVEFIDAMEWNINEVNVIRGVITRFRLYRVEGELWTLYREFDRGTLSYWHRRNSRESERYAMTAVDSEGRESRPLYFQSQNTSPEE